MNTYKQSVLALILLLSFLYVAGCSATSVAAADEGSFAETSDSTTEAPAIYDSYVTVAQAIGEDKPIVLHFEPVGVCRQQHCASAELIASRLLEHYGDTVNFVYVPVYAVSTDDAPVRPDYPLVAWDVYMVPPYDSWVPEITLTEHGWDLESSQIVVINSGKQVVYQANAAQVTWEELAPYLSESTSQ